MLRLLAFTLITSITGVQMIFQFNSDSNIDNWIIVNDGVMGGRSIGSFSLNEEGHGLFEGKISLENNGGFSSVRYGTEAISTKGRSKIVLRLKGDGKNYQLRIKAKGKDYYSYAYTFETSGEWEEIKVSLRDMYPTFRGQKLRINNFDQKSIEEVGFLIANKKEESFELLLDKIELK